MRLSLAALGVALITTRRRACRVAGSLAGLAGRIGWCFGGLNAGMVCNPRPAQDKKEGVQCEIAALGWETQRRFEQDAAATDREPSKIPNFEVRGQNLVVNKRLGLSMSM